MRVAPNVTNLSVTGHIALSACEVLNAYAPQLQRCALWLQPFTAREWHQFARLRPLLSVLTELDWGKSKEPLSDLRVELPNLKRLTGTPACHLSRV